MTGVGAKRLAALAVAIGIATSAPGVATAENKGKKAAPAQAVDVKSIGAKLKSQDPGKIAEGLDAAQKSGPGAAAVALAIEEILQRGATNDLAKAAIEALGAIGDPSASAVLRAYVHHRSPDVRRAAIQALVTTKGPDAVLAFKEGLRTNDAFVRASSAIGLGKLGAHDALPELFGALDRDVNEAAAAIGQLCQPAECDSFVAKLGKMKLEVMIAGFDPILFRSQPLPEESLLKIVATLRALGTKEAAKYLVDVQARWPKSGSLRVKQAIDGAVTALQSNKGS